MTFQRIDINGSDPLINKKDVKDSIMFKLASQLESRPVPTKQQKPNKHVLKLPQGGLPHPASTELCLCTLSVTDLPFSAENVHRYIDNTHPTSNP